MQGHGSSWPTAFRAARCSRLAPEGLGEADERWVAPAWPAFALPIRRWLAAKAFASWIALQGEGLRTTVALSPRRARGAAGRGGARLGRGRPRVLDADLLQEAVRRADLLLVHLADPEALARRLSRCESRDALDASRVGHLK